MGFLQRPLAGAIDLLLCFSMNAVQWRHRLHANSLQELETYIDRCQKLTPAEYYALPERSYAVPLEGDSITVGSPIRTEFFENDIVQVDLFPCEHGWSAPTVLMLHALMSASDTGYRRWARGYNQHGWNACFIHLPFHYSRTPPGHRNGELAITPNLVRTAEALRQGVVDLRMVMRILRTHGCREFGVLATSYGAWIGSLLAAVERDFRFLALMAPIVDVSHAMWNTAAGWHVRRELRNAGITRELVESHFHLSSPAHNPPLCGGKRVLFAAGIYDRLARLEDIEATHKAWPGSELLRVPQGHFGYRMMGQVYQRIREKWLLECGRTSPL